MQDWQRKRKKQRGLSGSSQRHRRDSRKKAVDVEGEEKVWGQKLQSN